MIRALVFLCILFISRISSGQQYVISTIAGGVPPSTPVPAASASIGDPPRVAVDSSGNIYFAGVHCVFKVDSSGTLTRLAGTGRYGSNGDGGAATLAQLEYPDGIAVDPAGNVFVTDKDANVVRRIDLNGTIATVAGTGINGSSGDGGPATRAQFGGPTGLTFDSVGNLYIADTDNNRIRMISPAGIVTTVAGGNGPGYSGDGGPAASAQLGGPQGVTVDAAGNLFIADTSNNVVRKVAPGGTISTYAGTGFPGFSGDSGPPASAMLFLPTDVALDRSGNLFIADLGTVRIRMISNGTISTVVGSAGGSPLADGRLASSISLKGPTGVAVDSAGNIYFAEGSIGSGSDLDVGDFRVWKSTAGVISTLAGNGLNSYSGDGGPAVRAQVDTPAGMVVDSAGNVYFADSANHRVRKIAADGSVVTVAGTGTPGYGGDGGPAAAALLNQPMGLAVDGQFNLYIADTGNNRLRIVDPTGNIATIAGVGNAAFFGDGGLSLNAAVHAPRGVAIDSGGNLYIADTLDHRVRKITLDGMINTIAGKGLPGFSGDGGPAVNAMLNFPSSVAVDASGNLYIADQANNRIRMVSTTGIISTVVGSNGLNGLGDGGPATSAQIIAPQGVTIDSAGNLYISDSGENLIRKVGSDGAITTIAGNGRCCYSNDGIPAALAPVNVPWGIATNANGNVYLADSGNNAVRELLPVRLGAVQAVVANGASNLTGAIAPGETVELYGTGLGPVQPVAYQFGGGATVGTQLGGVSVLFNGIFAPILYASANQVTAVVPYGVAGPSAQVVASFQSLITLSTSVGVASAAPALFTINSSGTGQAVATNQDGSANGPAHPAVPGSVITLYATGEGQTSPAGIDGQPAAAPLPRPVLPVTVTIGGLAAVVQSAQEAAGEIGVMQVTVQVPGGVQFGNAVPVALQVGGIPSPAGVTIAVN